MNKLQFTVTFFLLCICFEIVYGDSVSIYGTAKGNEHKVIRLVIPSDPFSGLEQTIGSTSIDSLGNFQLKATVRETVFGWIVIGFSRSEVYLYPGLALQLNIAVLQDVKPGRNPFLDPPPLRIVMISEKPHSLNSDITKFNSTYDDFTAHFGIELRNRRKTNLTDSLNTLISDNHPDTSDAYFRDYVFYKLSEINVFLREMRYPRAYKLYLEKSSLNFSNIAFSDFFNAFFENYIPAQSKAITTNDLDICINKRSDLAGLLDSLGKDSLLRNEKIRELVLLKHLPLFYHSDLYSRANIIHMLETIATSGKFNDQRVIAMNLEKQLTRFNEGASLPEFSFSKRDGQKINSFEGSVSCLIFFTTNCEICNREQDLIPAMQQKFGDKVRFISICCDEQNYALDVYSREHPSYRWEFLSFNIDYSFLEEMEIKSFPLVMLLDEHGKILQYPAKLPSNKLETVLSRILR